MRPVTYYRLSLLLPVLFPFLILPVPALGPLGLILIVGMMYYGVGYLVFATGVLFWLRRPHDPADLPVAVVLGPFVFAPLGAISVTLVSLGAGTEGAAGLVQSLLVAAGLSVAVGLCYAIPIAAVGALWFKETGKVVHAA